MKAGVLTFTCARHTREGRTSKETCWYRQPGETSIQKVHHAVEFKQFIKNMAAGDLYLGISYIKTLVEVMWLNALVENDTKIFHWIIFTNHLLKIKVRASIVCSLSCSIISKSYLNQDTINCYWIKYYLMDVF